MTDPDFDVESYRMIHESNTEWTLRKQFIMAHHDKFEKNRLLCLSSCFINIECYGCRYPQEVMRQVKELSLDVESIEDHRNSVKQKMEVQFVTAGSSHTKTSIKTTSKKMPVKKGPIMFVKASPQAESLQSQELSIGEAKSNISKLKIGEKVEQSHNSNTKGLVASFLNLQKFVRELVGKKSHNSDYNLIVEACSKAKMKNEHAQASPQDNLFCCELHIDHVFVANGKTTSKKAAMHQAYENAVKLLSTGSNPKIICKESDKKELIMSNSSEVQISSGSGKFNINPSTSAPNTLNETKRKRSYEDSTFMKELEEFIIMEPVLEGSTATAVSILGNSACINKFSIDYDFRQELEMVKCDLTLGGHLVASVVGTGQQAAKYQAAEKALSILKLKSWTIQTKQTVDSAEQDVSKNEILGEKVESDVIPESNIGNQLLKKMGWSSGGLGKDSKGISEPVSVSSVIHRQGLGLLQDHGVHKSFLPKIRQMISDYVKSDNQDDLAFAPDFNKEERNIIHQLARKLGLKSHSHGKEDNRFLVLSRKRSVHELFSHIKSQGGETSKYRLLAPGESLESVHD